MPELLDIHLLRVLHLVLQENSVSRAADRLGITQPAVSSALRRLRQITGDKLLVRTRNGMTATERGLQLIEPLRHALDAIDSILLGAEPFDPATTTRSFSIGAPDYFDALFLSNLAQRFRSHAPNARIHIRALSMDIDFERLLEEGELDIVIGNWPNPPDNLRTSPLFDDEVVCIMSERHPLARHETLSAEHYLAANHLAPVLCASGVRGAIDEHLHKLGIKRTIRMSLPYFHVAPYILMNSDLIFTTGRRFAAHYCKLLPLRMIPAPLDFPPLRFYQLWHERTHAADATRWLREQVTQLARLQQAL